MPQQSNRRLQSKIKRWSLRPLTNPVLSWSWARRSCPTAPRPMRRRSSMASRLPCTTQRSLPSRSRLRLPLTRRLKWLQANRQSNYPWSIQPQVTKILPCRVSKWLLPPQQLKRQDSKDRARPSRMAPQSNALYRQLSRRPFLSPNRKLWCPLRLRRHLVNRSWSRKAPCLLTRLPLPSP